VLALPPWSAGALLEASGLESGPTGAFEPEPIATAWALWHADHAPSLPRWSLLDEDPARGRHGQWLFDRGVAHAGGEHPARARVAGIVISVASRLDGLSPEAVAAGVSAQITEAFGGPPPAAMRLVTERRATFRCTPQRPRLRPDHFGDRADGLWLAGDWLWPDYPATLEAAVRSGQAAAALALRR
ncbi:MAG TPA: FAD-dependent oxidoreductase, partial [Quisquiliibacterium sp.]|nr:FAD-dependent oxidoreductase [Quisquiliibacterium sp.]